MTASLIAVSTLALWVGLGAALIRILGADFRPYFSRPGGRHAR